MTKLLYSYTCGRRLSYSLNLIYSTSHRSRHRCNRCYTVHRHSAASGSPHEAVSICVVIITNYTKQASRLSNCVGYFYMDYLEYLCFLVKPVAKALHVLVPACSMVNVTCHIVYMLTASSCVTMGHNHTDVPL